MIDSARKGRVCPDFQICYGKGKIFAELFGGKNGHYYQYLAE
jgi:hypothetical protein